jgi:hypothetical protein
MSDETKPKHHHTIRERVDAAEAAADEVVANEGGQLSGEVNALAVPFEEAAAALRAAIHPDRLAEEGEEHNAGAHSDELGESEPDTDQG